MFDNRIKNEASQYLNLLQIGVFFLLNMREYLIILLAQVRAQDKGGADGGLTGPAGHYHPQTRQLSLQLQSASFPPLFPFIQMQILNGAFVLGVGMFPGTPSLLSCLVNTI
jgi:hypothetical protein